MPTCIFILARFTLRVDGVMFRTYDTRMFHSLTSVPPVIVRQTSGREAPYDRVKRVSEYLKSVKTLFDHFDQQLPRRDDLTPLTDPNFVGKILTEMPSETSQRVGASTGWRGLGTKVEVAILKQQPS